MSLMIHWHFFLYFDINQNTLKQVENRKQKKQIYKQIKFYEKTCTFSVKEFVKTYDDLVNKGHQIDGESFDDFLQYETPFYMKKALEFRHLSR